MKSQNTILLVLSFSGVIFIACHKETATTPKKAVQNNTVVNTLSAFYQQNGAPAQNFTVNATSGGTITGAKGTKFFFSPQSFINSQNQMVSGNVNIQIKEIYSPADMILSNMPTTSNGRGLLSEGEFFIVATQAGKTLRLDTGHVFNAHLPLVDSAAVVDSMEVFTYDTINRNWEQCSSYGNSVTYLPDSISLTSDSLTWCNSDAYYRGSSLYQVTVTAVNSPSISQTAVYMYVNGHHAIWQLSPTGSGNQFVTPTDIPQGAPLTIVGLALSSGGTVYSSFMSYTNPGNNQAVNMSFDSTTISIFKTQLAALH